MEIYFIIKHERYTYVSTGKMAISIFFFNEIGNYFINSFLETMIYDTSSKTHIFYTCQGISVLHETFNK